ncbi:hypothetical protein EXIGLDRAFT_490055 [Exidia glandulosa HHB12029]|uniref:Zinc finger PHD-type domain-containing protein n=1 Tax=Exidia glandulosa HHB12029 TaxID=1314781 RepID=A0A165JMJ3_EXIGL|nr:hypothetical protein EXIGLDRAFT_490055 [Exidia glandulosa HHB12029]
MQEAGYVVCATCGDYAVDFNAVMLDCSTCENSYHHTCVGMGLGELGRRTAATNAMRKSKGKKGGADGDGAGDVTGTLYDWMCPDCHQQQQPRVPEPDKEEVLVIEDTDDEDEDDGERTTYIDLSYNVDIHRVAPSQRALLPTTTVRRPAVHMQNVAGLLNRSNSNVGASTSTSRAADSNIGASTSTSKPVPAATSASPTSHNGVPPTTASGATPRNVQTPLSPPPSRSPSRTGPIAPVPFVDFTAMATSSKKRRRSSEVGEGGLEDERAKKKSRFDLLCC